jgi:hypothetical protein
LGLFFHHFLSHRYHPIELIKVQDFSYSFSLGVSHLWLSYSPRQSHLSSVDHTLNAYNALQCITFLKYRGFDFHLSHLSPPSKYGMNFLVTILKPFRTIISEETLRTLSITSFIYIIISYKTRLLLNSYMGLHFSSFHFKNSIESFISMILKTQTTLACVSFFIFRFAYYFWFSLNS